MSTPTDPCPRCGAAVINAREADGTPVVLDARPAGETMTVDTTWAPPLLVRSPAYRVHATCPPPTRDMFERTPDA